MAADKKRVAERKEAVDEGISHETDDESETSGDRRAIAALLQRAKWLEEGVRGKGMPMDATSSGSQE